MRNCERMRKPKKKKCTRLWAFDFGYDIRCKMIDEWKKKKGKKKERKKELA
jgi:hypothetical protein